MTHQAQKVCAKCKALKPVSEFKRHPRRKDGLQENCTQCVRAYNRHYYRRNRDKVRKATREYAKANRLKVIERRKAFYRENRQTIRARNDEWAATHRDRLRSYQKRYREQHAAVAISQFAQG